MSACRCFGNARSMFIKERSKCREIRGYEYKRVDGGSVISLKAYRSDVKSDIRDGIYSMESERGWRSGRVRHDMTSREFGKWSEVVLSACDMIGLSEMLTLVMTISRVYPYVCVAIKTCWVRLKVT